ncbi:MAG: hypothetical protein D3917_04675 [Candidatus Electrothrix sp. AX5]|nr:hypothetical protein [Candidatus Electrothrix sp. AX5]
MIRESILAELKRRFPAESYAIGDEGNTVAVFPAECPDVGNVTIWDDGDEATILIENITHGHFNLYDDSLSESERDKQITKEVCDFLEGLFLNKVLLWRSERSGGWRNAPDGVKPEWLKNPGEYFLWSGRHKTVASGQPKN